MTEELIALGRRAAACEGWRWMPGMDVYDSATDYQWRIESSAHVEDAETEGYLDRNATPDLSDPATLGCLLALAREAHGDPRLHCYTIGARRWAIGSEGRYFGEWSTETEALVAALEAAP